jgi:hypothetical protein
MDRTKAYTSFPVSLFPLRAALRLVAAALALVILSVGLATGVPRLLVVEPTGGVAAAIHVPLWFEK